MAAAKRVLRYLCSTSGMGLVLGGRRPVVLTGHADASWADDQVTQRSSQGYTFSLGSGSVLWRSTRSSSVLSSSCEAEIYAGAMAAQELCWLTYLLTDLGEQPRSPPVLYVDNKAVLALCREHRLEHRTKHIALRYFLARELQQRGQLRLAYVASEANTADIFTKGTSAWFSYFYGKRGADFLPACPAVARAAPPPPPSPPSPSSMGTGGRGCEGVADVPQQQQLPPRLLPYLSLPHLVLGEGGELGGSGGGRRGSAAPAPPPFSSTPAAGAAVGGRGSAAVVGGSLEVQGEAGGDLQHQPPPPPPFLLHPCCGCSSGGEEICSSSGGRGFAASAPPPLSPPSPAAGAAVGGGYGGGGSTPGPARRFLRANTATTDTATTATAAASTAATAADATTTATTAATAAPLSCSYLLGRNGAARGTPRPPFFEGCSPTPLAPSYTSAATTDVLDAEDVGAASASAKRRSSKGKGGRGGGGGSGSGGGGSSGGGGGSGDDGSGGTRGGSGGSGGDGRGSSGSGGNGGGGTGGGRTGARRGGSRVIAARMSFAQVTVLIKHAGDTEHRCFFHLDDAWHAEFGDEVERTRWADLLRSGVSIFDLEFDAMLSAMYALSVSTEGDCYQCVPPDPGIAAAALGANESGTLPSTAPAEAWHTFTLDSGALRYFFHDSTTLTPLSALVPVRLADPSGGPVVARSSTVLLCPAVAPPCLCRLLSHQTLLWHHRLGHPSLPRLRGMHSRLLVSSLPRSLPPLPPSLAPPCLQCVEGQHRAAPHSSSFHWTTAPLQTLLMDVKGEVPDVLIPWIHTVHLQLRERFGLDLSVLHLHFDRGADGFAECRIGLVMEVARTSMIHAAAPHFLWPFAVRYASHQLNLWLRVSLPETSPTLRWTGEVGDASVFRDWGSRALVRDTSADKLSTRAIPCVFLGFHPDAPGWQF
ncbi:unnamed protein product [Closterium sp. NIES-54]